MSLSQRAAGPTGVLQPEHAGKCARRIGLDLVGAPREEMPASMWATDLADLVRGRALKVLAASRHDERLVFEVPWTLPDLGVDGKAHFVQDVRHGLRVRRVGHVTVVGGYAFKRMTGMIPQPQGPSHDTVAAGALAALALQADELVIVAVSTEVASSRVATRIGVSRSGTGRFSAQWVLPRDRYEPIARTEVTRLLGVARRVGGGFLPPRKIPALGNAAEIVRPESGTWIAPGMRGTTWHCDVCPYQERCIDIGTGRQPLAAAFHQRAGNDASAKT